MGIFAARDLSIFYRGLSDLLASGTSIIETLGSLSAHGGSGGLQSVADSMRQDVAGGATLAEAFAKFPQIFPSWHVDIIKYSEKAGRLAEDIGLLAGYLEKEYDNQLGILVKLAYPVLLLHVAFLLLPIIGSVTCGGKSYIAGLLGLVIPVYGTIFVFIGLRYLIQRTQFKTVYDYVLANIPFLGALARQLILTRFIRALRCLNSSGVPIVSAWNMSADACGNEFIKTALTSSGKLIEQGQPLSKAFIQSGVFSGRTITMIVSAEKSGTIVRTLNSISTYYEKENEAAIEALSATIPVIVYLLVAGFIGFRVVSFYTGYFQRISSF